MREPTDTGTLAPCRRYTARRRTPSQATDDLHEWITFEDPDEQRTWVFDATYLRSNYTCIYGEGCQGVLDAPAAEMEQGCCSYGAHFVDDDDVQTSCSAFVRVRARTHAVPRQGREEGLLDRRRRPTDDGNPTTVTRLVDDACIFLNRPGFEGGVGCALHIAALEVGERPLDWKPNVCWQVPIRLEHSTDENGHVTSRLREWKRRDWGEGGNDFHWWCTEAPEAFVGDDAAVRRSARRDRRARRCSTIYDLMVEQLERAELGAARRTRRCAAERRRLSRPAAEAMISRRRHRRRRRRT